MSEEKVAFDEQGGDEHLENQREEPPHGLGDLSRRFPMTDQAAPQIVTIMLKVFQELHAELDSVTDIAQSAGPLFRLHCFEAAPLRLALIAPHGLDAVLGGVKNSQGL